MRKQAKKILSIVMSAAMALSLGAGVDMTKADAADTYTAEFMYTGSDWKSDKGKTAEVKLEKGTAEYTVSLGISGDAGNVLCVDIKDFAKAAKDANLTITLKDLKLKADGKDVKVDLAKVLSGDIEEKGTYRIELYNQYGKTKDAPPIDKSLTWSKSFDVTFTLDIVDPSAPADPSAAPSADATAAPSADATAAPSAAPSADATVAPSAAPVAPTAADLVGTAKMDCSADGWRSNGNSKWEDATINGPATYSVVTTFDEPVEVGDYMAVRIPELDKIYQYIIFSDVTVWIDGKCIKDYPVNYGGDGDCRIELVNNWGSSPTPASLDGVEYTQVKVQFTLGISETKLRNHKDKADQNGTIPTIEQPDYEYSYTDPNAPVVTPDPEKPAVTKNPAKSVKASKKSVSVKKGKKVNVIFKVTAKDNKKKTTDKVKATSSNKKIAKILNTTVKPGKVVVSVKGVKKGTAKITLKVGSKKATVKVKVKK